MADCLMRIGALPILFCLAAPVLAQSGFVDPTRPPVGSLSTVETAGEVSGPVLQSVMIPKKGKPMALIGGQQVFLGGMYGESRLISLTERKAVLEGPSGTEYLYLTPGVEKTNIVVKTSAGKRGQSKGKP
jgi:MSHA biogenesis protein MshK